MGEMRNACKILVGKPEGKRPLGRPRRRWGDYNGMDLTEIWWEGVYWMHTDKDRDVGGLVMKVMKLRFP
jgi:hypothetical protein